MLPGMELISVLHRHAIPLVLIGGHAVNVHGFARVTEDIDVVWQRSTSSEAALLAALTEIDARFIADEIDPATGIERTCPVTSPFIQQAHSMMLWTRLGFLDLFDSVPGLPRESVSALFTDAIEADGVKYASLGWLKRMKIASNRGKDRLDLENLPD